MKLSKNSNNNNLSDNSNYILYNTSNYKTIINDSIDNILEKLVNIIKEYIKFISDKINMKNKPYYRFILERGLETILHIFSVIYYYTKNLDLTFYHCQKAYYFYVEFIEQISDDNITFLKLSSRDAILFVYKKTIYDLNNEYKKNLSEPNSNEKNILSTIDSFTFIYKNTFIFMINNSDFTNENKEQFVNKYCNYLDEFNKCLNLNKLKSNYIDCTYCITNLLVFKEININNYFLLLREFIKKLQSKKKIDDKKIINKIYDSEINNSISDDKDIIKVIEFIFAE
jgi:hypothetical protein